MSAATEVREIGILFSAPMVRAVLDDTKNQTRRTRGLDRINAAPDAVTFDRWQDGYADGRRRAVFIDSTGEPGGIVCPYGQPGDRLWVRESHYRWTGCGEAPESWVRAPGGDIYQSRAYVGETEADGLHKHAAAAVIVPSILMPRWASRLTLEVVSVCVERVQDITRDDCEAEGIKQRWTCLNPGTGSYAHDNDVQDDYRKLWDSLNASRGYGWGVNPWVWVIEFRRLPS